MKQSLRVVTTYINAVYNVEWDDASRECSKGDDGEFSSWLRVSLKTSCTCLSTSAATISG